MKSPTSDALEHWRERTGLALLTLDYQVLLTEMVGAVVKCGRYGLAVGK